MIEKSREAKDVKKYPETFIKAREAFCQTNKRVRCYLTSRPLIKRNSSLRSN